MTEIASRPLVSVVIPAFQAERFLGEALESVRCQTHRPVETIVVNDGSTDGTGEVIDRFAEVRSVSLPHNLGQAAARNAGLALATGELVTFLDADDTMTPDRLEVQVRYLVAHPSCGCVLGRQEIFVEPGSSIPIERLAPSSEDEHAVTVMTAMVRAEIVLGGLGFDPACRLSEDMDWILRLQAAGVRIDFIDDVVLHRRLHGANISLRTAENQTALLRVVRRLTDPGRS